MSDPNKTTIYDNITLCLTIGKRPIELEKTLISLLSRVPFTHIIAINDFRDEETNEIFRKYCPNGKLINLPKQVGHHLAIDHMYQEVKTEFIFHCEDDWLFTSNIDIQKLIEVLNTSSNATMICFRKLSDFSFTERELNKINHFQHCDLSLVHLKNLHKQWYGYTFNPHLTTINTWKQTNGFKNFKKERHISRWFRKQSKYVLFLENGLCQHIGFESISNPKKTPWFMRFFN
ncbi:glycosyltransferase [Acinetobacter towneri]|uniref:glycosyltransferase n=1 Tax=Acinetobacter towneri TaxID=202956 RepID=UPI0025772401|nr:glycosyltransferase [Acinetobacter towneri]MDM1486792.1 glycosyltransferase [Acinetobacter towneri]